MFSSKFFPSAIIAASTLLHFTSALPQVPTGETNDPNGGYGLGYTIYGTGLYNDRCKPLDVLNASLEDVELMAKAGLVAARHLDQPPFSYFFGYDIAPYVRHVVTNLLRFLENPRDHIGQLDFDCSNPVACDGGRANATNGSMSMQQLAAVKRLDPPTLPRHTSWIVSMCPFAQANLARSPPACTTNPGVPSLGWAMAKALVQLANIVEETYDDVQGPVACHKYVTARDPFVINNAENYAYFLQWSLDLGYGLGEGKQCLDRWVEHPEDVLQDWMKESLKG
ncbi:MAG: hypothetical protein LQ346_007933 [Caloplaca aetnensis]|nr:MAG: hypothetical protein LQ346_007933 [Caloplaca aetnensis]